VDAALPSFRQPAAVWLNNLDEDAMTLEILEGLRAFHVGRDWFAAYRRRPARRGIGQSTAENATPSGASRPAPVTAPRGHACDLIQRVWYALERSRERARLRESLYRLSDWELKDIGIYRGEIEHIVVSGDQRPFQQSTNEFTSSDRPEQCDALVELRPFW
jgi:uncharacterized protein YjiS (DUF1127 family)